MRFEHFYAVSWKNSLILLAFVILSMRYIEHFKHFVIKIHNEIKQKENKSMPKVSLSLFRGNEMILTSKKTRQKTITVLLNSRRVTEKKVENERNAMKLLVLCLACVTPLTILTIPFHSLRQYCLYSAQRTDLQSFIHRAQDKYSIACATHIYYMKIQSCNERRPRFHFSFNFNQFNVEPTLPQ